MLLFLILLFFGSRLTPYLCLLKWCFCFNLFFTLFLFCQELTLIFFKYPVETDDISKILCYTK